ncbi:MAG TPA: glucosamine-6-phosphate deaminase [Thermoanaerobaculia bacterium]|nr:glucosamine-6-phosphate deaminase [Thermoanaerobaculia bacterium]
MPDYDALSARAATILLESVRFDPKITLGLPTGSTPLGMYARVVAECQRDYHCFREVTTFNLDEYVGIPRDDQSSYATYMHRNLFDHVDVDRSQTYIPDGNAPDLELECRRYEQQIRDAGGLHLTFLGLGRNGHIAFNEPGTPFRSRTRVVELTESTRAANQRFFEGRDAPTRAMTMGIATILESKRIVLLATGSGKEDAIAKLRSRTVDVTFPASALWTHPNVHVLVA